MIINLHFEHNKYGIFNTLAAVAIPVTYYVVDTCVYMWNITYKCGAVVKTVPGPPTKFLTGNLHQVKHTNQTYQSFQHHNYLSTKYSL